MSTREIRYATYTLDSTLADTPIIDYSNCAGGALILPAVTSITSLTWFGAGARDGTFTRIYDSGGVVVAAQTAAASRAIAIPDACYPYPFLKCQSDADGAVIFVGKT